MILVSSRLLNSARRCLTIGVVSLIAAGPLTAQAQDGSTARPEPSKSQSAPTSDRVESSSTLKSAAPADSKARSSSPESTGTSGAGDDLGGVVDSAITQSLFSAAGAQPVAQDQSSITKPLALSPEVTRQRVGVDPNYKESLSIHDGIAMALRNNLDIEVARQGVQISQYNLFAQQGFYDITSGAEFNMLSQTIPVTSLIQGGNESVTSRSLTYNFFSRQQLEKTGGSWQVDFDNSRRSTNSTFATLDPQYSPAFTFSFTQPLMRNLSIDASRRQLRLLKRTVDLSDSQFRQRVIDTINQVQRAYWDLVFAIRNEQIARDAVDLARVQLENNRKMVEAGTLAPIELRSTEAQLESGKEQVITALQNITTAENFLKGLLLQNSDDKFWNAEVVPVDQPQFGQPTLSLGESFGLALRNRPELEQLKIQSELNGIDTTYFKNQLKPQVDFIGFYTATGTAGNPADASSGPLPGGGPSVPERLQGGYFQALRNLLGQDFRVYQVGVSISFPWRNRTAEANLGRSLAEARQLDARMRSTVQGVQIEVRNALQAVDAARRRYEAAQANRIAAEAQLSGEEERFRAGLSTNFLVLQRQTDLSAARGSELRALTDYNKALADLQRVTGMTLTDNNVEVAPAVSGK